MIKMSLSVSLLALGLAVAGCTNYTDVDGTEEAAALDDELVRVAAKGDNISVEISNESIQKTLSFSKDYGSGNNTFAATAIVTTKATFNMSGTLGMTPTWNSSRTRLNQLKASLNGSWNIQGGVDVEFKLTGKAAANKSYVQSATKDLAKMIEETRVLKSFAVPAFKTPIAEVTPAVELVLDCQAGANAEFSARAEAGIKGSVGYDLFWNREEPTGTVPKCPANGKPASVPSHWKFANRTPTPTITPPAFNVSKADGSISFKCAMRPRLSLDMSLGVKDVLEAALSADVEGGVFVSGAASANASTKAWSATAAMGMQMNAHANLKLTVFCKEVVVEGANYSRALIGPNEEGVELAKKTFQGTLM